MRHAASPQGMISRQLPPSAPAAGRALTIVHVSTQRHWYGGEEQAHLLARGLRDRGHRCVIWARRNSAFAARLRADGFELHTFLGNGRHAPAILSLRRWLIAERPDAMHFHDAHALTTGGLASRGLPIAARVASRRCDYALRFTVKYRWLTDRVIAVSQAVADVCRASGVPDDHLRVVHDGVDRQRCATGDRRRGRRSLGIDEDVPLLLVVASLNPSKGHADLLEALPAVLRRRPELRAVFAGDGERRGALEAQAQHLGLEGAVRFLGYRRDVPDLLQAADLLVLPSRIEPLGSSLIDAMLAGLPIVTTTAGGIPELVGERDGEAPVALLVPPRDPPALADAISKALDDREGCTAMSARARVRALRCFTAEQMVEGSLAVYRELMAARAAAGPRLNGHRSPHQRT